MRKVLTTVLIEKSQCPLAYFITGDLGFMAFEEVRLSYGRRFINAGVSEQNMIGVAAGLAKSGIKPIVYSIAPFCYARPFEQIRNDICMSNLPVCLVGNGGGYAYGHMGPTHHALEDCAVMNAIGMHVIVPAFDSDIPSIFCDITKPTYIRLGIDQSPSHVESPPYAPWRKLLDGDNGVMVTLGPLAGSALTTLLDLSPSSRPSLWCICEFADNLIPDSFLKDVINKTLIILEEHVESGGLSMNLALSLCKRSIFPRNTIIRSALRYPTGRYGSQKYHCSQSGLDPESINSLILTL